MATAECKHSKNIYIYAKNELLVFPKKITELVAIHS